MVFVKELLNRDDPLVHISDDAAVPSGRNVSTEHVETYKKKDRIARSHLFLHLSKEAVTNVTSALVQDASANFI